MVYPDTNKIRELREQFDFHGRGDISLAVPYSEQEGITSMHRRFYEDIARGIESLGKSCFLPHRDLPQGLQEGNPIEVLMSVVVPTCDLLFYHANMGADRGPSHAMLSAANLGYLFHRRAEPIWFIEEERHEDLHEPSEFKVITFSDHQNGANKIRRAVKEFYQARR